MAPAGSGSWRIDETYVKVRGRWAYLYRAHDKFGDTIDFYLSATRNTKAAKRFLGKALKGWKDWELPEVLNTDKAPTYAAAIAELEAEGKCPKETRHRQVEYLNNVVEADHGKLKQLIRPVRGFKTMKTANATIKGFEVPVADGVAAVPAHRPEHDLPPKVAPLEIVHALTPRYSPRRQFTEQVELCNRAT